MAKRKTELGLGRGLNALLGDPELPAQGEGSVALPISQVEPGLNQPRKRFEQGALDDLAESIRVHGIIQPLTVRRLASGYYQIIAGERRWRAAKAAGLQEVPAVIIEADDRKVMELGLIENLQREDLNPAEEARGYRTLMEEYGLTQEQVAQQMGKSRPAITNTLRLLALPDEVMALMEEGTLSAGHARAILGAPSPALQKEAAARVVKEQLSVRQTEALVRALQKEKKEKPKETGPDLSLYLGELEKDLAGRLGRKVKIAHKGKKGRIELEYYSEQDLETLLELLRRTDGEGVDTYGFF
ncbi:MAG: ParB/RepB/Spo0J family partition protein [Lawsonibacter sp.]|jgi:ParB family chromosome partitioning protein|nr:ParB/RepB/Spo0J family partition protein [Lawsonibacter sp.]